MSRAQLILLGLTLSGCSGRIGGAMNPPPAAAADGGMSSVVMTADAGASSSPPPKPLDMCSPAQVLAPLVGIGGEDLRLGLEEIDPKYERARSYDFKTFNDNTAFGLIDDLVWLSGAPQIWLDGAGLSPYRSCTVGQAFGYSCALLERKEVQWSAIGVHVLYEMAWRTCQSMWEQGPAVAPPWLLGTRGAYSHLDASPVTQENAQRYCLHQQQYSWSREPDADELEACVELALALAADQPPEADPKAVWVHVCAAVLASANAAFF